MGSGCEPQVEFPTREEPLSVTWIVHVQAVAPGAVEPECRRVYAHVVPTDSIEADPGHAAVGASGNEP